MRAQMHGLIPDHSKAALLILDMISDFQFPDGPKVRKSPTLHVGPGGGPLGSE